jgi:cytochrome oxidase Cu insertion factor (SCO1/SenC/PrrC family)
MTLGPRWVWIAVSAFASLTPGLVAHTTPPQAPQGLALPDVGKLGPQIGERVPDFTLTDQHGQPRTLASLMGAKGLMLVFYRSADW